MRRLLALSVILLALAAGQAGAQSTADGVNLRGAQGSDAAQSDGAQADQRQGGQTQARKTGSRAPVEAPEPVIAAPPPPLMSMLPQPEAPLCRSTCARSYYFCLSGGDAAEDCSGSWAQCAARCNRPST